MKTFRACEGWNQDVELAVEVHDDHLVWTRDALRLTQERKDFLEKGPPAPWERFTAFHLQEEFPRQAVELNWRFALEQLRRAAADPAHDSRSWYAHLETVELIHRRLLRDPEGWQARLAELRRLSPAPPDLPQRLRRLERRRRLAEIEGAPGGDRLLADLKAALAERRAIDAAAWAARYALPPETVRQALDALSEEA